MSRHGAAAVEWHRNVSPPEGWERDDQKDEARKPRPAVDAYWCEKTGDVYEWDAPYGQFVKDGIHTPECVLRQFGCVPVRKTKPAVPEFFVNLAQRIAEMTGVGDSVPLNEAINHLAENCVPKADADEMLDALKDACNTLLEYPSKDNIRRKCNALIERMEGK